MDQTPILLPATLLLFLVILPWLNATADYLSVAATRAFLRRIATHKLGAGGVLLGLTFDIIIAMGCLTLLLWLITQTLDLWAQLAPALLPFDWRDYRATICGGDWQAGTMLWLMLLTTLAPTALHLTAGAGAIFSHSARLDAQIKAILDPAQARLQAEFGDTPENGDGIRARKVLTAGMIHRLEALLARKEGAARLVAVALFVVSMVMLVGLVIWMASTIAPTRLCPQLDATTILA